MIAVLADTHMPKGARRLPERCVELIEASEALIHAGDFIAMSTLAELQGADLGDPRRPRKCRRAEVATSTAGRAGGGDRRAHGRPHPRCRPCQGPARAPASPFPDADAVIFGHSHLPLHESKSQLSDLQPRQPDRAPSSAAALDGASRSRKRRPRLRARLALVDRGLVSFTTSLPDPTATPAARPFQDARSGLPQFETACKKSMCDYEVGSNPVGAPDRPARLSS